MIPKVIEAKELEELTEWTDRRHRQIADQGFFAKPKKSRYKGKETLQGLFKYLRQSEADTPKNRAELRKLNEAADEIALRNEETRARLVDKADFLKRFEAIYTEMRQRIMNSSMRDHEKDALLGGLSRLHEL